MFRSPVIPAASLALMLVIPAAAGEHARRAAAELAVIGGDLRRIQSEELSRLHRSGLDARINGGLSALPILLRLADQEEGRRTKDHGNLVTGLRNAWKSEVPTAALAFIDNLEKLYPLDDGAFFALAPTMAGLAQAQQLHEELCAGCHDEPDSSVARPAFNLFQQAMRLSKHQFTARMIVGIRGDRVTGIDNPFSDWQLAALMAFYRAGQTGK